MSKQRPRILILNASLAGEAGNTAVALETMRRGLARGRKAEVRSLALAATGTATGVAGERRGKGFAEVKAELAWAEALVFGTGTHWDSWSSVLQKFLEEATESEGTALWLGKPAACVVTEHSVGGKGVLSRLQGVLVTLGCQIPPMSGVVLSKVAQMATEAKGQGTRGKFQEGGGPLAGARGYGRSGGSSREGHSLALVATEAMAGVEDFWCAEDLKVVAHNLVEAVRGSRRWKAWPVDRTEFAARWIEEE